MARTHHHRGQKNRHNGQDLFSRRPLAWQSYSSVNKRLCRQKEHAMAKQLVHCEVRDADSN